MDTMLNTQAFTERLEKLLAHYDLTASSFADAIGVQRSSISHLLSGRNRPSLDFVMKVVGRYPEVDLYWLLNGRGSFPPAPVAPGNTGTASAHPSTAGGTGREIERVVLFFSDGTFHTYLPGKGPGITAP